MNKSEEERRRLLAIIEIHSPQSWGSFKGLGELDFSDEKLQDMIGVRRSFPPKADQKSSAKIGRYKVDYLYNISIGYRNSYSEFGTFVPLKHHHRYF